MSTDSKKRFYIHHHINHLSLEVFRENHLEDFLSGYFIDYKNDLCHILYHAVELEHHKRTKPKFYSREQKKRKDISALGYSYQGFDDTHCIYIHIPKCAGIAINEALFNSIGAGHVSLLDCLHVFEPDVFQNYFKFTVVRNPWDRLVSSFHYLKYGNSKTDAKWTETYLKPYKDFEMFVKEGLNKKDIIEGLHFKPQISFITIKDSPIKLDFIAYYENINNDYMYIRKKLDINRPLKKLNTTQHKDYKTYYTDEMKDIVADVYNDDIKLLGYTFDNSSLKKQLIRRKNEYLKING